MTARTIVVGDIHGELEHLERLLGRLPALVDDDTLVFLGDYIDRGPDSKGVIGRVRSLCDDSPAKVVLLRGNHEDAWSARYPEPEPGFMLNRGNGCFNTYRSYVGGPPVTEEEDLEADEFVRFIDVASWLPADVVDWMRELPSWYEDDHAIYVHAGLEAVGDGWAHPRDSTTEQLTRRREPGFFSGYQGKLLVFGHTPTTELPTDHLGPIRRWFGDPGDVWRRGDLYGIDTGCGKGGFLSALELPRKKVYESRD